VNLPHDEPMAPRKSMAPRSIGEITRRYYAIGWFYSFANGFLFGMYPLFLRSRGLNQFQVNSVLAVFFIVTFLTDVPTGAFADAISRRTAFMLACAIRTCAFTLYFFSHTYILFLVAETIDGIGMTFGNGAIDAWAVDELDAVGFEGIKDRVFSRSSQLVNVGFMASAIIGAYVGDIDLSWPWLLGAASYMICGFVAGRLMRGEVRKVRKIELGGLAREILTRIRSGLREGFARRTVLLLALANAAELCSWAPLGMEWPAYFKDSLHSGVWIIGWLFCIFAIGRLIGAEIIVRYRPDESRRAHWLAALMLSTAAAICAMGAGVGRPALVLFCYFLTNMFSGAVIPLSASWFNEQVQADNRATLLSFQSTFATLGGAIGLLVNGRIADTAGLPSAWALAGLISVVAVPCYWAMRPPLPQPKLASQPAK
jgi:MFS family permease